MQLVSPEIVAQARGLSVAVQGGALAVGLFLWLFGARGHRFWIALVITLGAGLIGLFHGPAYGMQPLVAGLLLAVAAGALALSLVRVLLFVAGGFAGLAIVHGVAPAWDEPVVSFLVGGLGGILLYRFWIMTLTSLFGTLLIAYSGLSLLDLFKALDAESWSRHNGALLNWGCGAAAVTGILVQFLLERGRKRRAKARLAQQWEEENAEVYLHDADRLRQPTRSAWRPWGQKRTPRRAS
jgi:hypothetical protein